jgi:hypothetical protein
VLEFVLAEVFRKGFHTGVFGDLARGGWHLPRVLKVNSLRYRHMMGFGCGIDGQEITCRCEHCLCSLRHDHSPIAAMRACHRAAIGCDTDTKERGLQPFMRHYPPLLLD